MIDFRYRPALLGFLGLATGLILQRSGAIAIDLFALAFLPIAFGLLALALPRFWQLAFAFCSAVAFGWLLGSLDAHSFEADRLRAISLYKPQHVRLTGVVDEIDETESGKLYIVEVDSISIVGDMLPLHGRVALWYSLSSVAKQGTAIPLLFDCVIAYTPLEPLENPRNPYEHPADDHLRRAHDVTARGTVKGEFDFYRTGSTQHLSIAQRIRKASNDAITWIDGKLAIAIDDEPTLAFIRAVVLGERVEMGRTRLQEFSRAGVSHILAVSGFNVAIVSLVVTELLRLLWVRRRRLRIALSMIAVLLYCQLVGFQPSVLRAFLMIELMFLAMLVERKPDILNILAGSAIISLVIRPSDLFDAGFQLSYAAVAGLAIIYPEMKRIFVEPMQADERPRWSIRLVEAFSVAVAATLATLPVAASVFHRFSIVGLLVNLIAIPLSSLLTAMGFLLIPLTAISHYLGALYGTGVIWLTRLLLILTHYASEAPFASVSVPSLVKGMGPIGLIGLIGLTSLIYVLRAKSLRQAVPRLSIVLAGLIVIVLLPTPEVSSLLQNDRLTMVAFDVGQGDCILLHTPNDRSYFIDFGSPSNGEKPSKFERSVLPTLIAEGIHPIDAGFISHMHTDHYGGAPEAITMPSIGTIMTSGERASGMLARELDSLTSSRHIALRALHQGDILSLDSDIRLYVLHPAAGNVAHFGYYGARMNSGSLGLLVVYGRTRMLFLGDMEASDEEAMLEEYGSFLNANVVKVAHHGSLTSSSKQFVGAVQAQYAVICVGQNNRFGHPAPAVTRRWIDAGADVLRTDQEGAIILTSNGRSVERVQWRMSEP